MDQYVKSKLLNWSLGEYIKIFEENEIDEDAFKSLTPDVVKTVIPKVGPYLKFMKKWNADVDAADNNVQVEVENKSSENHTGSPKSVESTSTQPHPFAEVNVADIKEERLDPLDGLNLRELIAEAIAKIDVELQSTEPIDDLIKLLQKSVKGVALLSSYKFNACFSDYERITLVDIIVDHEIRSYPNLSISPARMLELANLIKQTFPTEQTETYYVPYNYCQVTKKKTLRRGKLNDKHGDYRRILIKSKIAETRKGRKRKSKNDKYYYEESRVVVLAFTSVLNAAAEYLGDEQNLIEKLTWLKANTGPWATVKQYWKDTSAYRLKELINSAVDYDYTSDFKILTHPDYGYQLVEMDFSSTYPSKVLCLYQEYQCFQEEVLVYAKGHTKSSEVKSLIILIDKTVDPDLRTILILKLLPLLLPSFSQVISSDKGECKSFTWKPSKLEALAAFIIHAKDEEELKALLIARKKKAIDYKLKERPVMVFLEKDEKISKSFVYLDGFRYDLPSPLRAIDVAFKSFFSLQVPYPKEASSSWMVVQKRIYSMASESDAEIPAVYTFLNELNLTKLV